MPTVHHEGSRLQQAGRAIAAAGLVIVSILAGLLGVTFFLASIKALQ